MDEPECSSHENQEDTSSASAKPARRRRLAHRRQYAKSRRLASSFLRSQFVRYDTFESQDSWCQTAGSDNANPSEQQAGGGDGNANRAELGLRGAHLVQGPHSPPTQADGSPPIDWTKFETDECRAAKSKALQRPVGGGQDEPVQCGRQRQQQPPREQEVYFANYSSSSLDSYSLLDHSYNATTSIAPSKQKSMPPLPTGARSLNFLANLVESNSDVLRPDDLSGLRGQLTDRVVRSETIDLNRVRCQPDSPKFKQFPSTRLSRGEKQASNLELAKDPQKLTSWLGSIDRFVSLQRLADQSPPTKARSEAPSVSASCSCYFLFRMSPISSCPLQLPLINFGH